MPIAISGTLANGKYPRILHSGNRLKPHTFDPGVQQDDNYPAFAIDDGSTVDRWRPFTNSLSNPNSLEEWQTLNCTIEDDNQTVTADNISGACRISLTGQQTSAQGFIIAAKIAPLTYGFIRLSYDDGTTTHEANFDLTDNTVISTGGGAFAETITRQIDGSIMLKFAANMSSSSAGIMQLHFIDDAGGNTPTLTTADKFKVLELYKHLNFASVDIFTLGAKPANIFCAAGLNMADSGGRIQILHDENENGIYTQIDQLDPTDRGPAMFLFDEITSARWRISISRTVMPEIAVGWFGDALVFERPFYGGFTVPRMDRNTQIMGNISGTGELLGRSKKRTTLSASYSWSNLTYDWVRANLDGPDGLIQSAESEPLFVAWRPSETQDVDYLMRAQVQAPRAAGSRDLHSFGMSGEAYAYE
jgi:hypothetical protein